MVTQPQLARVAVVLHPTRRIDTALESLQRGAEAHGLELVQIPGARQREPRGVAKLQ